MLVLKFPPKLCVWHPAFIYIVASNKWWWHFYWEFKLHSVRIIDVRYSICITLSISSHLSQSRLAGYSRGRALPFLRVTPQCQNNTGLFLMQNIGDKWHFCLQLKIASDYNWKAGGESSRSGLVKSLNSGSWNVMILGWEEIEIQLK